MFMKKCIILLVLLFLCFGCKAQYTIKINSDKSVEESVTGLETEEYYNRYPKSSKERVIRFSTYLVDSYIDKNNYDRIIVKKGEYTGETIEKKYKNLKDYFEYSKVYKQLYETFDTSIDGKIVTISLKNKLPKNGNSVDRYIIDDCEVKIILPFKVKEHNADSFDENSNSYIWNLNIDDTKEIYIQFDTGQKTKKEPLNISLEFICIGFLIIVLGLVVVVFRKKKHTVNRI